MTDKPKMRRAMCPECRSTRLALWTSGGLDIVVSLCENCLNFWVLVNRCQSDDGSAST